MSRKTIIGLVMLMMASLTLSSCRNTPGELLQEGYFTNPLNHNLNNTAFYFHEGSYYHVQSSNGKMYIQKVDDPTEADFASMSLVCEVKPEYGLEHLWYPQIINIDGKWYIYVTADSGNTDDHKMYVFVNENEDPFEGQFVLGGRLITDPGDNWAIHGNVFRYAGQLYMVWSGWESRRAYVETQCLYISRMTDPLTLSGDRVMIASPEYDWERQTVNTNGFSLRYPVYVVEHPVFFSDEKSDKAYIFYTASAGWTAFSCIGELSAEKLSDFLDPASWTKSPVPVFTQDREAAVYGPSAPYFTPSKDGKRWYLVYSAVPDDKQPHDRVICLKTVTFDEAGHPVLGQPAGWDERVIKASSTPRR